MKKTACHSLKKKSFSPFRFFKNAAGVTLIEVMVAVVVLACGLLLILEGMSRSQQGLRVAGNLVTASLIAEDLLAQDEIRAREFGFSSSGSNAGAVEVPGRRFEWKLQRTPFRHETIQDETFLNKIGVELKWREGPHREGGLNLATLQMTREKQA